MNTCPNQFPVVDPGRRRLCLVGENPSDTEFRYLTPFCGAAGSLLNRLLGALGLPRNAVMVGNLCQHYGKHFDWAWDSAEVQTGIAALLRDLATFRPNLVMPLGNAALHLFMNGNVPPPTRRSKGRIELAWTHHITDWRGSLFLSSELCTPMLATLSPAEGTGEPAASPVVHAGEVVARPDTAAARWKCLPSVHPAFVLRSMSEIFNLRQDLRRALAECSDPRLTLPELDFAYGPA